MAHHKKSNVRVQSETTNQTSQRKKKGKTKTTESFSENLKITDIDSGEVTTMRTTEETKSRTNRRGKTRTKGKLKEDFEVRDAGGKLLMKDKKRMTSRNGKTRINRNRARVTRNYRQSNRA